jgi:hypothetical protein
MYDHLRVFLLKDYPHKIVAYNFNGRPKRTLRPKRMTLIDWLGEYGIERRRKSCKII